MNESRDLRKEKKQNIQVFVRVRPTNDAERAGKSVTVVDIVPDKQLIVRERPHDKFTKKFTFDKVFGPLSKQIDVYNAVVSPLLDEVLAGYNCTVFAYGQTGTGKTFTMEGANNDPSVHWETDSNTGIIPRALSHVFSELSTLDVQEYTVRVSYLQLYNEEISDLLSSSDDCSKIRIYEDSTKKGAVIVHGLEEVTVHDKSEVYKILHKGSEKRQTAATLMNAHSSRSHTIFSITVHIKENSIDGEELLKTGKLNLVDLAGSENVGRSGAIDRRAREAGNINQSLLTLGRVITALMERTPHIPYRESKLTRLLQESLGGRTKTSIIATVSPASINLEETLSTLDYAHRAKNITNRPEINQKLSKKALLREYTEELERLRKNLQASRERNGVYLAVDNYNEMQGLIEFQGKEIEEKENHIKALQEAMKNKEQIFNDLQSKHCAQADELLNTKNQLQTTIDVFKTTTARLEIAEQEREEQKHLLEKHVSTENVLLSQAQEVLDVAETATTDANKLHEKVYRKKHVEQQNTYLAQQFKSSTAEQIRDVENNIYTHAKELIEFCTLMKTQIGTETVSHCNSMDESIRNISEGLVNSERNAIDVLRNNINNSYSRYQRWLQTEVENAATATDRECLNLTDISLKLAPKIQQLVENKITENMRALNDDVSRRIANLTTCAKTSITSICNNGIKQRDSLFNDIEEVKANVEYVRENSKKITEKRENFAKTMEDLQLRFHNLRKEEQDSDSTESNKLSHIDEVCSNICNRAAHTCNENIEQERGLEKRFESDLEIVKADVASAAHKCSTIAEDAVIQSKTLLNELQLDLGKNSESLTNYKNCLEHSVNLIQQKLENDQRIILASVNDTCATICNAEREYVKCLQTGKTAFSNATTKILSTFESERAYTETMNNTITAQLKTIRDQVEKFVVNDLQHDVSTGSTPAKKDFQYPKKLTATSPHERILVRFREASKNIDTVEEETSNSLS